MRTRKYRGGLARFGLVACVALMMAVAASRARSAEPHPGKQHAQTPPPQSNRTATARVADDYTIGPSDVLAVNVWKDTELTRTVLVRPDGKISLPLAGELEVSGLTALKVQALVAQRLKEYIDNPQVTVIVQEVKSRTYIVVGKITKPGSYELGKPTTILEALAIAGGFQEFAKPNKIYVIRHSENGSVIKLPFDYKSVIKGHHSDQNVLLQSGDTIVVP